jgi:hypothetical protein
MHTDRLHPYRLARLAALPVALPVALMGALAPAEPAGAASYNVSALVTGTAEPTPMFVTTPIVPCTSACQYTQASSTGLTNSYTMLPGPYVTGTWPPVFQASQPGVAAVSEELPIAAPPAGSVLDGGYTGVRRRSAVDFAWQPVLSGSREIGVQTWQTGSGASVVSHAIKVTVPGHTTQRTWLEFGVPASESSWSHAYYLQSNQYFYSYPKRLQTRSAVDVYVDGLPVWSSSSNLLRPQRWGKSTLNDIRLDWGQSLDEGTATLFLGTLKGGNTYTVSVVIRTDLRVDAPECRGTSEYGTWHERCHSQLEALSLPAKLVSSGGVYPSLSYKPDIRIYTR